MPGLLIKNVPSKLHRKLKSMALLHHRSLTREALALLEQALSETLFGRRELPPPFRGRFPLTNEFINAAKREGRA